MHLHGFLLEGTRDQTSYHSRDDNRSVERLRYSKTKTFRKFLNARFTISASCQQSPTDVRPGILRKNKRWNSNYAESLWKNRAKHNLARSWNSLRASSPVWASETSLARARGRAAKPRGAFARSREAGFACPNRRACSQANRKTAQWIGGKTKVRDQGTKWNCAGHVAKRTDNRWTNRIRSGCPGGTEEDQGRHGRTAQIVS